MASKWSEAKNWCIDCSNFEIDFFHLPFVQRSPATRRLGDGYMSIRDYDALIEQLVSFLVSLKLNDTGSQTLTQSTSKLE